MVRNSDSAMQRLQVGLIGLLVVLLFVSLASMLTDRVDGPGKVGAPEDTAQAGGPAGGKDAKDEPVVDVSVTPVVADQPEKQSAKLPANAVPANPQQ